MLTINESRIAEEKKGLIPAQILEKIQAIIEETENKEMELHEKETAQAKGGMSMGTLKELSTTNRMSLYESALGDIKCWAEEIEE